MINLGSLFRIIITVVLILALEAAAWGSPQATPVGPVEPTFTLKRVKFSGNKIISKRKLRKELTMTLPSRWPLKKLPLFKEEGLERDLNRLKAFYQKQGFFHAKITPKVQKDEEGRVTLTFNIKEGPWVKVASIELMVGETERKLDFKKLKEKRPLKPGDRLIAPDYESLKRLYLNYLLDNGFPQANVTGKVYVTEKLNTAKIMLYITPNLFSYFGEVKIEGKPKTPQYIILRKLTFKKGDVFSFKEIYDSQRNLYSLDLFSSVAITPEEVPKTGRVIPLTIKVKEKKKRAVSLAAGYGDEEGLRLRGTLRLRNLAGGGRTLDFTGKYSSIDSYFNMTFTNPQLLASYFDLIVSGAAGLRDYPSFDDRFLVFQTRLERQLPWKFRTNFGYLIQFDKPFDIPFTTLLTFTEPQDRTFRTSMAFGGLSQNTTDSDTYPTRGGLLTARGEVSPDFLGANLQFASTILGARRYINLYKKKLILASRVKLGLLGPIQETREIPIFRRFFAGGYNSVRGYRLYYLGPRDTDGFPLGGNALLEGSGELRFPIYKILGGVAFVDFGNVYPQIADLDIGQLKYSAGVGVRVQTPVGPVGVDIGVPLNPIDPQRDTFRIHFTIGQAF